MKPSYPQEAKEILIIIYLFEINFHFCIFIVTQSKQKYIYPCATYSCGTLSWFILCFRRFIWLWTLVKQVSQKAVESRPSPWSPKHSAHSQPANFPQTIHWRGAEKILFVRSVNTFVIVKMTFSYSWIDLESLKIFDMLEWVVWGIKLQYFDLIMSEVWLWDQLRWTTIRSKK